MDHRYKLEKTKYFVKFSRTPMFYKDFNYDSTVEYEKFPCDTDVKYTTYRQYNRYHMDKNSIAYTRKSLDRFLLAPIHEMNYLDWVKAWRVYYKDLSVKIRTLKKRRQNVLIQREADSISRVIEQLAHEATVMLNMRYVNKLKYHDMKRKHNNA